MIFRIRYLLFFLFLISATFLQAQPKLPEPVDSMAGAPAPLFSLNDLNGKVVNLADYKGKVVVLMFWSTWCHPCHQDFPSVKQAVTHFAGDSNVVFLFIDTREYAADYKALVRKDLAVQQYNFPVLFDETVPDGKQDKYYAAYRLIGIPTKFIIDGNGIVRYQLTGYNPSLTKEEATARLQQLIEKAKQ